MWEGYVLVSLQGYIIRRIILRLRANAEPFTEIYLTPLEKMYNRGLF